MAASQVLTSGTFQGVVDQLTDISNTGNLADIATINANRCANVLPAIDVYFAAVAQATGAQGVYQAIRPAACGGTR
ncbi:hypothetical protein G7Y89_g4227 [Cudoniella acicularis]|uniref:Uncharacterized protein n=1 Tax=Cudoniella acicularis TaxID=354080 RepID=A0A8H4W4H4_9HELO|nr:hypothetical protein G7Y89_g4227 [Cudoniella acicularis]